MQDPRTRLDKINNRIRNNPVLALLVAISTLVIGLSTFTNATRNLLELLIVSEQRPAINGLWQATVVYDWPNATYQESFNFAGTDNKIYGSASFTGANHGILEGKVVGKTLTFITKSAELLGGSGSAMEAIHRYYGQITGDEIKFVMQTEGGYSPHIPVEFTAKRNQPTAEPLPIQAN